MKIITQTITLNDLKQLAQRLFGDMIKGVVDIEKGIIAVDAELHSDLEALLLEKGSQRKDLWGITLYPGTGDEGFIEFDSMINVRPSQGNRIRGIQDEGVRKRIVEIVEERIVP